MKANRIKGFMFDLDGTLALGDRTGKSYDALPGAIKVLSHLRERGIPYVVLTNGSGKLPAAQAARLYVASDVPFFASRGGHTIGSSYAFNGAVRRMTAVRAIITGKPSLHALRFVAHRPGVRMSEVGVVEDDPEVEMHMARLGKAAGIGVCTGTTGRAEWRKQKPYRRPHHVIEGVYGLLERKGGGG